MVVWLNPANLTLEIALTVANIQHKIPSEMAISLYSVYTMALTVAQCQLLMGGGGRGCCATSLTRLAPQQTPDPVCLGLQFY